MVLEVEEEMQRSVIEEAQAPVVNYVSLLFSLLKLFSEKITEFGGKVYNVYSINKNFSTTRCICTIILSV